MRIPFLNMETAKRKQHSKFTKTNYQLIEMFNEKSVKIKNYVENVMREIINEMTNILYKNPKF